MRTIHHHVVSGDTAGQLEIRTIDDAGAGGAFHNYVIDGFHTKTNASAQTPVCADDTSLHVLFQNGPIKEHGVNGITQEALLAIVIDRLECFQNGPFASEHNDVALRNVRLAMHALQARTIDRIARDVEGRNVA